MADGQLRIKFLKKIDDILQQKKRNDNLQFISDQRYSSIIADLKRMHSAPDEKKTVKDYRTLRRFAYKDISGVERLVKKDDPFIVIVPTSEFYDVIHTAHIETGHGGRNVMEHHIARTYAKVPREAVMVYLSLCEACQLKRCQPKKHVVVKPIISPEMGSRGQVKRKNTYHNQPIATRFKLHFFPGLRALKTKF